MNRSEAKELLPVIQAYADGKEVQCLRHSGWTDTENPSFLLEYEWRVKPEKKVCYLNVYPSGVACLYSSKSFADAYAPHNRIACIRIEYTEGQFDD